MIKEEITRRIRAGDEPYTGSSDYVFCPYCGFAHSTRWGWEEFPELYEEGEHKLTCDNCKQMFYLDTIVDYFYETRKEEE